MSMCLSHLTCNILSRLIAVGDSIKEDEVVCEIETDKVKKKKTYNFRGIMTVTVADWCKCFAVSLCRRQCRCPLRLQE